MDRDTCSSCGSLIIEPAAVVEIGWPGRAPLRFDACSSCAAELTARLSARRRGARVGPAGPMELEVPAGPELETKCG